MPLTAAAAQALATIILRSTQGAENLDPQLPLVAEDRDTSWLVKGTPYTDQRNGLRFVMSHVFLDKASAEVLGLGSHGRLMPTEDEETSLAAVLPPAAYAAMSHPATDFEPGGIQEIYLSARGGLINTPADATDYAAILLQASGRCTGLTKTDLAVVECEKVWHATLRGVEVISFSRTSGKLLSGNL